MNDAASSCVQHGLQTITMASKLASTDIPGWCESRIRCVMDMDTA
jgi:hypothetical protein